MTICYFDAFSGIAGDMTVGALLDAGANAEALIAALDSLNTGASFEVEKTRRRGITASKFHVRVAAARHSHRHLHSILEMIDAASLTPRARDHARRIFTKLGEAEAAVHGVPVEKVHFHEVGAADSIADIVGASVALDLLGVDAIESSAVNTGSGTVKTEHGILPVPAPATALLLKGCPVYARGPEMELTTPTGAAILAALAQRFGPMPALRIASIGYGAGDRDFAEHANVLRCVIGQASGASESTLISVLEANLDDASPQVLGYAMDRLIAAGALDVSLSPVTMKKNRPGTLLRVLASPGDQEKLAELIFAETPTLGLRIYSAERRVQARSFTEVQTEWGPVRIKVAANGEFAPEYEDCRVLAEKSGVPLRKVLAEAGFLYRKSIE